MHRNAARTHARTHASYNSHDSKAVLAAAHQFFWYLSGLRYQVANALPASQNGHMLEPGVCMYIYQHHLLPPSYQAPEAAVEVDNTLESQSWDPVGTPLLGGTGLGFTQTFCLGRRRRRADHRPLCSYFFFFSDSGLSHSLTHRPHVKSVSVFDVSDCRGRSCCIDPRIPGRPCMLASGDRSWALFFVVVVVVFHPRTGGRPRHPEQCGECPVCTKYQQPGFLLHTNR